MNYLPTSKNQRGFTIVELMIATSVLAVILLFVSVMMINVGNLYYKAVSKSHMQNAVRTVTADVSDNLELSSGNLISVPPTTASQNVGAYCVGGVRYSYVLYRKLGTDSSVTDMSGASTPVTTKHVLWRDAVNTGGCSIPTDFLTADTPQGGAGGSEEMPVNTRLTSFDITGTSPYNISISAAFGDQDLMTDLAANKYNVQCKGGAGQQFCATAQQQTTVTRRLGE